MRLLATFTGYRSYRHLSATIFVVFFGNALQEILIVTSPTAYLFFTRKGKKILSKNKASQDDT